MAASPRWMSRAACTGLDSSLFFENMYSEDAIQICRTACPVRCQCLQFAMEHRERDGVWGGMIEEDRRRLVPRLAERGAA